LNKEDRRKKRARIGNEGKRAAEKKEEKKKQREKPPSLAIRRSDKSNQLTHLPTCSTCNDP